ncbi:MAG TPA: hypothetical protein VG407_06990 [Caulobacteraceae bacterium]|nr:hypothetical protein [Caulobacteraceae bacterium]
MDKLDAALNEAAEAEDLRDILTAFDEVAELLSTAWKTESPRARYPVAYAMLYVRRKWPADFMTLSDVVAVTAWRSGVSTTRSKPGKLKADSVAALHEEILPFVAITLRLKPPATTKVTRTLAELTRADKRKLEDIRTFMQENGGFERKLERKGAKRKRSATPIGRRPGPVRSDR